MQTNHSNHLRFMVIPTKPSSKIQGREGVNMDNNPGVNSDVFSCFIGIVLHYDPEIDLTSL